MTTYTALTTMPGEDAAYALSEALEHLDPEPIGTGVFEIEDGSGLWEVAAYMTDRPDAGVLAVLSALHGAKPFTISEIPDSGLGVQGSARSGTRACGAVFRLRIT